MAIRAGLGGVMAVALLAAGLPASAEELQVRTGVVTAIQPVVVEAARPATLSRSRKKQLGGMLGYAVGQATGGSVAQGYALGSLAAELGSNVAASRDNAVPSDGYTFHVRFDDASEAAFSKSREHLLRVQVGTRVRVVGSGSGASLSPE
jgi:outer membrane lipoprotein SlyB